MLYTGIVFDLDVRYAQVILDKYSNIQHDNL